MPQVNINLWPVNCKQSRNFERAFGYEVKSKRVKSGLVTQVSMSA